MTSLNSVGLLKHCFPITTGLSHAANLKVELDDVKLRHSTNSNSRRDQPIACFNALQNYVANLETQRPGSLSVRLQARKVANGIEFLIWINRQFLQELCHILPTPSLEIHGLVPEATPEPISFRQRFRVQDVAESTTTHRVLIMHVWSHNLLFTPASSVSRMLNLTISIGWIRSPMLKPVPPVQQVAESVPEKIFLKEVPNNFVIVPRPRGKGYKLCKLYRGGKCVHKRGHYKPVKAMQGNVQSFCHCSQDGGCHKVCKMIDV